MEATTSLSYSRPMEISCDSLTSMSCRDPVAGFTAQPATRPAARVATTGSRGMAPKRSNRTQIKEGGCDLRLEGPLAHLGPFESSTQLDHAVDHNRIVFRNEGLAFGICHLHHAFEPLQDARSFYCLEICRVVVEPGNPALPVLHRADRLGGRSVPRDGAPLPGVGDVHEAARALPLIPVLERVGVMVDLLAHPTAGRQAHVQARACRA